MFAWIVVWCLKHTDAWLCLSSHYSVYPWLSAWCVSAGMGRWPSCVTLWSSEHSWMLILQKNQWNQCCPLESFLLVRHRERDIHLHSLPERVFYYHLILTGSTDVVSCSVHGVRDPVTAALHIVLGKLGLLFIGQEASISWTIKHISLKNVLMFWKTLMKNSINPKVIPWNCLFMSSLVNSTFIPSRKPVESLCLC